MMLKLEIQDSFMKLRLDEIEYEYRYDDQINSYSRVSRIRIAS